MRASALDDAERESLGLDERAGTILERRLDATRGAGGAGLSVGTAMTLLAVPALYAVFYRVEVPKPA